MSVVVTYMKAFGLTAVMWMTAGYLVQILADLASNIWLSEWSEDSTDPEHAADPMMRLGVYGGIGASQSESNFFYPFKHVTASHMWILSIFCCTSIKAAVNTTF